jgi:surface antigen
LPTAQNCHARNAQEIVKECPADSARGSLGDGMARHSRLLTALAFIAAVGLAAPPLPALADPPPWAPAYGYRAKHDHKHKYKHKHDDDDDDRVVYVVPYGIEHGQCDRGIVSSEVVGGVIGGAVGGVAGAQFGKGKGKTAATIGGAIVGVLVGASIGRSMDEVDQNCVGRILEHAPDRQRIRWAGERGADYTVVPLRTYEADGAYCREYQTEATVGGRVQHVYGTACRQPDGAWKIVN